MGKIKTGRFGKTHGIKGWLRIISFTDPPEKIFTYQPWYIKKEQQWQQVHFENNQQHGKSYIVKLPNIDTPETAQSYVNLDIWIDHQQLPKLPKGEYYWSDLEGLQVINQSDQILGTVNHLMATGANDVLVVKNGKKHLIPYIDDVIIKVDLKEQVIRVNWDADF